MKMDKLEKIFYIACVCAMLFNLTILITGVINNLEMRHIILRAVSFLLCLYIIYLLPIKINKK